MVSLLGTSHAVILYFTVNGLNTDIRIYIHLHIYLIICDCFMVLGSSLLMCHILFYVLFFCVFVLVFCCMSFISKLASCLHVFSPFQLSSQLPLLLVSLPVFLISYLSAYSLHLVFVFLLCCWISLSLLPPFMFPVCFVNLNQLYVIKS